MMHRDGFQTTDDVIVLPHDGVEQTWSLGQRQSLESQWTLELTAPTGETWTSTGEGLWTAFTELRRQLDRIGYKLCCAGSRIDANMRSGRWASSDIVDLLSRRTLIGIRHTAPLLSYAPPRMIATVEEQQARYQRWLRTPWWRAIWPGTAVR